MQWYEIVVFVPKWAALLHLHTEVRIYTLKLAAGLLEVDADADAEHCAPHQQPHLL